MRIKVNDCTLFFDVEGSKLRPDGPQMKEVPTVLLLHGGPGFDHSTFKPFFAPLADSAQLIYLDHRGQGRSDRSSPDRWNLSQWADDVKAFCDLLEIEHPIVLGNSFGGFVAMAYAIRHPSHPRKLILSSTEATRSPEHVLAAFERKGGTQARAAAQAFWDNPSTETLTDYRRLCMPLYARSGFGKDANARVIWNLDLLFEWIKAEERTFNFLPQLSLIQCPTLITVGEEDPITPPPASEEIAKRIRPDLLRFERFADAGHGVFRDQPEKFFRLVRNFIASRSSA
jgi:proline iminopeptidase